MDKPDWYYLIKIEKARVDIAFLTGAPTGRSVAIRQLINNTRDGDPHFCHGCSRDLVRARREQSCSIAVAYRELVPVIGEELRPSAPRPISVKRVVLQAVKSMPARLPMQLFRFFVRILLS